MAQSSAIESLPVELHHHILSLSPDPPSLRSLALSCSVFYRAFVAREKATTTAVLSRHIHPQVQHEAVVALAASRLPARDPLALSIFVEEKLIVKDTPSSQLEWSLADALPAYRLYTHVSYFSQTLSCQLLSRPPFQTANSKHDDSGTSISTEISLPTLSSSELQRFERSLYRFEICCILYRLSASEEGRFWYTWFSQTPKFELEQLSCLNDLLTHLIAPGRFCTPNTHSFAMSLRLSSEAQVLKFCTAFNDLVQHDVSWGYFRVDLITDESSSLAQRVLTRGLETLHALAQAETYDERRRILHRGDGREDEPVGASGFLCDLLVSVPDTALIINMPLSEIPADKKAEALAIPTYPDIPGDPGPLRIFESVISHRWPVQLVAQIESRRYRRWGYVFWDEARLEKLGALTQDGPAELMAPEDPLGVYREVEARQLRESRIRRSQIWRQGGSGWWSKDDESKIVWPEKSPQKKRPLMTARSVQGAKDFLRGLKIPDVPKGKTEG